MNIKSTSCFLLAFSAFVLNNAGAANMSTTNMAVSAYTNEFYSLEKEWTATNSPSYFYKSMSLFNSVRAIDNTCFKSLSFQLDIASGMLLKSRCGSEFGPNGIAICRCQADVISQLAAQDISMVSHLSSWQELRARYARILMYQRSMWFSLRDPAFDNEPITMYSSIRVQPDPIPDAINHADRNNKIALQMVLKRVISETAPMIDRFMVAAFSSEPEDMRMLNEFLAIGGYSPEDRAKLVRVVGKTFGKISDINTQFPMTE